MVYKEEEFRNVAVANRKSLIKSSVIIPIGQNKYKFKISGIGQKAIQLEKFFYYSEIINSVQKGIDDGLEYLIEQIIIDPNKVKKPNLDSASELNLRATANKQALKKMSVDAYVGTKKYEFLIAGIGKKSIKIVIYIGYENISNELNQGKNINLEFILKEILVGNEVDYSIFENVIVDEAPVEILQENDEIVTKPVITKLSQNKSKELISKIEGVTKLIFDSVDDINSDIFTVNDVLEQDRIKSYAVQGKSFEPIIIKNIEELIDLGIISKGDDENYYKLW
ncbi:hypothetical protein [Methanobrevibacter sp.]|uniref:hypothetical protein n=1 Tax=Methanobrevibacter sp. TaxID=66852 RepID=UPI0038909BEA